SRDRSARFLPKHHHPVRCWWLQNDSADSQSSRVRDGKGEWAYCNSNEQYYIQLSTGWREKDLTRFAPGRGVQPAFLIPFRRETPRGSDWQGARWFSRRAV